MEDEHGSINIVGDSIHVNELITGIIVGCRGKVCQNSGNFICTNMIFNTLPPIKVIKQYNTNKNNNNDKYICFLSGLELGYIENNHSNCVSMLFDYLYGFIGDTNKSSKIIRVIICGNSLNNELLIENLTLFDFDREYKKKQKKQNQEIDHDIRKLDNYLSLLSKSVYIDIMPGKKDVSNCLMPQQKLHKCLFPKSHENNSFNLVTNPYKFNINNISILGTDGQNIDDILMYTKGLSKIDCLQLTLQSNIIAPTAPDTLSCYPFKLNDPFLINESPHVYFTANSNKYDIKYMYNNNNTSKKSQKMVLLSIPSFVKTKQIVLLNINKLECETIQFGVQ